MSRPTIDPITLEIARHRFSAIADEMGGVLRRTALSPNIKERADCSAAVFTADGEMLAQAEHSPGASILITWHPETIDAVRAAMEMQATGAEAVATTDRYLGI